MSKTNFHTIRELNYKDDVCKKLEETMHEHVRHLSQDNLVLSTELIM